RGEFQSNVLTSSPFLGRRVQARQLAVKTCLVFEDDVIYRETEVESAVRVEIRYFFRSVGGISLSDVSESATVSHGFKICRKPEILADSHSQKSMALCRAVFSSASPMAIDNGF